MFARLGMLFVLAVAIGMLGLGINQEEASAADKLVTIQPASGKVGTVVTAELFNAPPNDPITVIFKVPGDPILTTGTTDANGYAKFTFTIPYALGGTYPIFFTDFKCSCQIATNFTLIESREPTPTPQPPATPTVPAPTATPVTPLPTATATSTPQVPVLGTSQVGGGSGPNAGVLALGAMAVVTVLAWFVATRRTPGEAIAASADVESDQSPDYSTDLDFSTLDSLKRPLAGRSTSRATRSSGLGWAIGAGLAAVTGLVLLRRK